MFFSTISTPDNFCLLPNPTLDGGFSSTAPAAAIRCNHSGYFCPAMSPYCMDHLRVRPDHWVAPRDWPVVTGLPSHIFPWPMPPTWVPCGEVPSLPKGNLRPAIKTRCISGQTRVEWQLIGTGLVVHRGCLRKPPLGSCIPAFQCPCHALCPPLSPAVPSLVVSGYTGQVSGMNNLTGPERLVARPKGQQ